MKKNEPKQKMTGLIQLPTDILRYILSIVVYDTFVIDYPVYLGLGIVDNITRITRKGGDFYCLYSQSKMATLLKKLGLIHPATRRVLVDATIFYDQPGAIKLWGFNPSFFATLLGNSIKSPFF